MKRPVLFLNKPVCIHNNRRTRFEKYLGRLRWATEPPRRSTVQKFPNFKFWKKKFDIEILKFLGNRVKMGQIFIQNGPSEVVGLTKPVLVLTNLSPHHIFRSRTCSRFLISYVIIFIKYEFQIIMLNPKKTYIWTDFLGIKSRIFEEKRW